MTSLVTWQPIPIGLPTIDSAWGIEDRYGLSWWDALIVATAQAGECEYLLSENLQDGQEFDGLTALSPFSETPASILR